MKFALPQYVVFVATTVYRHTPYDGLAGFTTIWNRFPVASSTEQNPNAAPTVTVNVHAAVFPLVSVAVQVTVVVPSLNVEPDGGTHTTEAIMQLSVATGAG